MGWIVYVAILICLILGIPQGMAYILKTNYPMAAITSSSMWPSLKQGDLVLIKGIKDKSQIQEGDIVVYENPQGFTIHRVVKIYEDRIITKGDANNIADAPVNFDEIIGKAVVLRGDVFRVPMLGNISIMFNKNNS